MDNGQMPPVQKTIPVQPAGNGMPMVQQVQLMPEKKKDISGLVKTIVIIIVSLIAVTFIGLFIWMYMQYDEAQSDLDGKLAIAAAEARDEQATKDEEEFREREKYPYKTFSGPADYGQLTFEYPKTWSVYVAADASSGGDFNAYFNPIQVDAVGKDTINALRVTIRNKGFDDVVEEYQKAMDNYSCSSDIIFFKSAGKSLLVSINCTSTVPTSSNKSFILGMIFLTSISEL